MFGKLGDMAGMLQKAQEMQKNMARVQEELAELEVTGHSPCGKVEVVISGDLVVKRVTIKKECVETSDPEIVQDLVLAATNNAIDLAKNTAKEKMAEVTGGLNIPGIS